MSGESLPRPTGLSVYVPGGWQEISLQLNETVSVIGLHLSSRGPRVPSRGGGRGGEARREGVREGGRDY